MKNTTIPSHSTGWFVNIPIIVIIISKNNDEYNLQHQQRYFSWQIILPSVSLSFPSCPYVYLRFSHCSYGKCPVVSYSFPIVSPLVSMTMIFTHWKNNGKYGCPMVFLHFFPWLGDFSMVLFQVVQTSSDS